MSIANKLYDRSHGFTGDVSASNPDSLPVLYIDGSFKRAIIGYAYEGRIQIHNAVGACKVELVSGNLPVGYTLSVDNTTSEVVLKWPAFISGSVAIPNANFEKGDDGSWELGAGWSIMSGVTAPDPNDPGSTYQAQFAGINGESAIMSNFKAPVNGVSSITASVDVQQGASSENKAGAAVRVFFYDNVGFQVGGGDGNVVKSGSNSEWNTSTLTIAVPASAAYARIGASAYRKSQNRALWVDNLTWNLAQPSQGTNSTTTIPLEVKVTDSLKREAYWTGSVVIGPEVAVYNNSTAYYSNNNFTTQTNSNKTVIYTAEWSGGFLGAYSKDGSNIGIRFSSDGQNWTEKTPVNNPSSASGYGLISTDTAVLCIENWSGIYRSTDGGMTWTKTLSSSNTFASGSIFAKKGMIVVGNSGVANSYYSIDDGVTWKVLIGGANRNFVGLVFIGGKYHAVTDGGLRYVYDPAVPANGWVTGSFSLGSTVVTMDQVGDVVYISKSYPSLASYTTTDFNIFTAIPSLASARIYSFRQSPSGKVFAGGSSTTYIQIADGSFSLVQGLGPIGLGCIYCFAR